MKKSGSKKLSSQAFEVSSKDATSYIPSRGDIVCLDFDLRTGKEQAGHRSAIIVSPKEFNALSSLVFVCPITSKVKGFSFEVVLTEEVKTEGVVLIHHLKSVDWKTRKIKFIEPAPTTVIDEVCAKLKPLIFVS